MLCAVYRSPKKSQTYLYVEKKDDFSRVPAPLMQTFGKPLLVTLLNLTQRKALAQVDVEQLKGELAQKGFYLQLPPPEENLLKTHLQQQGKQPE